ncbi:SsgA family sporulation/cell division regulator (plasmid) [Streptosporangium sp. NBC_01495]|uniref:SsgA family sporulation/cell division regulator n=1 Tax=Streptosporangium sp. NBC_01495 TaxID=2903899 RepID=UPI002E353972|nr:SsgA family sporulation/cell division regulator [Streptosporangium sp. NBC_01495]
MRQPQIVYDVQLWPADNPGTRLMAALTYSVADPYAVRLAFFKGHRETVSYTFSRDVLAAGLHGPAGMGDMTVAPHEELPQHYLLITLRPKYGYPFEVYAEREIIADFVTQVFRQVPLGAEHVDVDAAIAAIFAKVTP